MKLIHCSDLHLDSKMEHNLTAQQARERNAEICATFSRLVSFAAENGVDAVLLAGDLFDTGRVSPRTAMFVLDGIRAAKDVEFFYLRGNHDESHDVFAGMELPDNFKASAISKFPNPPPSGIITTIFFIVSLPGFC